jgi:excisionase family DNA binding protein
MIIHEIEYLTIQQASDLIGKTHITVRKWIKNGMLTPYTFGNTKVWIKKQDAINLTK